MSIFGWPWNDSELRAALHRLAAETRRMQAAADMPPRPQLRRPDLSSLPPVTSGVPFTASRLDPAFDPCGAGPVKSKQIAAKRGTG
jgi:hypothetical protein